jgi:hypothetical protein
MATAALPVKAHIIYELQNPSLSENLLYISMINFTTKVFPHPAGPVKNIFKGDFSAVKL